MSEIEKTYDPKTFDVAEHWGYLDGCCLHQPQWTPGDVDEVLFVAAIDYEYGSQPGWHLGPKEGPESSQIVIVRLQDGAWGLLEDSEDCTGHGCRCYSFAGKYGSLDELIKMGIPESKREGLDLSAVLAG